MAEETSENNSATGTVKLPYFHRTLSEEDQRILGDNTPKPISDPVAAIAATQTPKTLSTSSAWNQGTTWEEKNCAKWGKETIEKLFSESKEYSSGAIKVVATGAKEVTGHAQITHTRGKTKYIYEYSFQVKLDITESGSSIAAGTTVSVIDATNDQLDDLEIEIKWGDKRPSNAAMSTIKDIINKSVKGMIVERMKVFESEFRKI